MRGAAGYLAMTSSPEVKRRLEPLARAGYRSGWRPSLADGPNRLAIIETIRRAVADNHDRRSPMTIYPVVIDVHLPAGLAGPDPIDIDVRCFLVTHSSGVVLVDTGTPGSTTVIADGLTRIGASWADVTDILLSHDHLDHIGSLPEVRAHAPNATVWANAPVTGRALDEGDIVRGLTVLATPGHTAGHVSLLHESGALLVGDLVGNENGALSRAPAQFTADADESRAVARPDRFNPLRSTAHLPRRRTSQSIRIPSPPPRFGPAVSVMNCRFHVCSDGSPAAPSFPWM